MNVTRKAEKLAANATGMFTTAIAQLEQANSLLARQEETHRQTSRDLNAQATQEHVLANQCVYAQAENQRVMNRLRDIVS